jgi:hypothetical protein
VGPLSGAAAFAMTTFGIRLPPVIFPIVYVDKFTIAMLVAMESVHLYILFLKSH